ncbi:hypothetical protein Tco_1013907 [Tanacetum coccineum]
MLLYSNAIVQYRLKKMKGVCGFSPSHKWRGFNDMVSFVPTQCLPTTLNSSPSQSLSQTHRSNKSLNKKFKNNNIGLTQREKEDGGIVVVSGFMLTPHIHELLKLHRYRLHSDDTSFLEGLDHQGFFSQRNSKAYMFVLRRHGLSDMCAASIRLVLIFARSRLEIEAQCALEEREVVEHRTVDADYEYEIEPAMQYELKIVGFHHFDTMIVILSSPLRFRVLEGISDNILAIKTTNAVDLDTSHKGKPHRLIERIAERLMSRTLGYCGGLKIVSSSYA